MDWNLIAVYTARAIALLISIPVHESAHAFTAYKLGDPTAKNYGRISLNPARHFDPIGALCMILVGFGWAKPVPTYAQSNFKTPKRDMAITAVAGPISNILLAFIFTLFYKIFYYASSYYVIFNTQSTFLAGNNVYEFITTVLVTMVYVNITLAVFNMLPIPPLDGSRLAMLFLPQKTYFSMMRYERYLILVLFAALWLGFLDYPLSFLTNAIYGLLNFATSFVDSLSEYIFYKIF